MRPPVTDEQKAEQAAWLQIFKADFLIKYGYEPNEDVIADAVEGRFPKNWNQSLNIHDSDDDGGDTSDRHAELVDPTAVVDPDDALPADVRRRTQPHGSTRGAFLTPKGDERNANKTETPVFISRLSQPHRRTVL